ncbi:MAG: hypothetical protein ACTHMI_01835 [Mucilaginibacter sp.]|uniref:hypothetical protein n=1 Tax=Mucilaginibacter sp. L3T2-6 TaxID=3062491 RepID=UPI002675381B|nr:hypothetical protein [Mucilaginibacter sp. L3T2-6]MDO3642517.1 hypothetical protein [Mucilaginibacter sp. L3T2-6]MDV6215087.1 hypothetical protein [Mucilaginibacter sp. L3T2-6]
MSTETIRERLREYIGFADDKKVQAMYTMVEDEIVQELDLWQDKDFLEELKSRLDDIDSGIDEGMTWDEVKTKARSELAAKR